MKFGDITKRLSGKQPLKEADSVAGGVALKTQHVEQKVIK